MSRYVTASRQGASAISSMIWATLESATRPAARVHLKSSEGFVRLAPSASGIARPKS